MTYEFSDILNHLPHRYPFLFVDKIVSVELGQSIHAQKMSQLMKIFLTAIFPINQSCQVF